MFSNLSHTKGGRAAVNDTDFASALLQIGFTHFDRGGDGLLFSHNPVLSRIPAGALPDGVCHFAMHKYHGMNRDRNIPPQFLRSREGDMRKNGLSSGLIIQWYDLGGEVDEEDVRRREAVGGEGVEGARGGEEGAGAEGGAGTGDGDGHEVVVHSDYVVFEG